MQTLYTMTIDTEEEWRWGEEWPTTNLSLANIQNLPRLQRLCHRHGVSPTYFVDRAVLDDDKARSTVLGLSQDGKLEIGMHIHPWNSPPLKNGSKVAVRETFIHNLDRQLILDKLDGVYSCFKKCGLQPTSFRGGRYSVGETAREFLQSHGFRADSSVVPFTTWADDGAPDYRNRDLYPVRIPPRASNGQPMWEIPLTFGFSRQPFQFWAKIHRCSERPVLRHFRLFGIASRLGLVRQAWLNFETEPVDSLLAFLHAIRGLKLPCICLTVHSSSLMAGKGVYTKTKADEEQIFSSIDRVFATLAQWPEFRSATMTECADHLEEMHNARVGN